MSQGDDCTGVNPLVAGVDIGGTKTEICIGSYRGTTFDCRYRQVLPSSDWRVRDMAADAPRLLELVSDLGEGAELAALGVGAHGCDDDLECEAFGAELRAQGRIGLIRVVNDAELMPLAMGRIGQIGLVSGTGSIAVCRSQEGGMISAGGWGWLIGDDGSAAGLVREAARNIAHALDAGASIEDPLIRGLYASLGEPALPRLGSALAQLGGAAAIGAHAPSVFAAHDRGSPLAARVIREGAEALAELVVNLERRGSAARHVVAGGSVITSQPALWQAFSAAVASRTEGRITAHLFSGQPVDGACRLAIELLRSAASPVRHQ